MIRIIIGGAMVVAVIGFIAYLTSYSQPVVYTKILDDEISSLEVELAEVEAAATAGTLTPEAAAAAYARITARLDTIQRTTYGTNTLTLSAADKKQLLENLERLQTLLVWYSGTLAAIDEAVTTLPEAEQRRLRSGGSSSLRQAAAETAVELEQHTEVVVDVEVEAEAGESFAEEFAAELASTTASSTEALNDEVEITTDTEVSADEEESGDVEVIEVEVETEAAVEVESEMLPEEEEAPSSDTATTAN